jgi:uncharacterized protein YcaQ
MDRASGRLKVRAGYLEPGVEPDDALCDGLAGAMTDLARFLGGTGVDVGDDGCVELMQALARRLQG